MQIIENNLQWSFSSLYYLLTKKIRSEQKKKPLREISTYHSYTLVTWSHNFIPNIFGQKLLKLSSLILGSLSCTYNVYAKYVKHIVGCILLVISSYSDLST